MTAMSSAQYFQSMKDEKEKEKEEKPNKEKDLVHNIYHVV